MAALQIPEDGLDFYVLDRLADDKAAPAEQHLLVCERCGEKAVGIG